MVSIVRETELSLWVIAGLHFSWRFTKLLGSTNWEVSAQGHEQVLGNKRFTIIRKPGRAVV